MFANLIVLLLSLLAGAGAVGMALAMQDKLVPDASHTMPNGAATTYSAAIDLGIKAGSASDFQPDYMELEVVIPSFTTTELADTQTITIAIVTAATSDLSSSPTVLATLGTFTGAGGAGAIGATYKFNLPRNVNRYVGTRAVKTGASNASTASGTVKAKF